MYPLEAPHTAKSTHGAVRAQGVSVLGFFLFTNSNDVVMRYMEKNGLPDLDTRLTGEHNWRVGLFVYDPVTKEWLKYAAKWSHPWLRVYGHTTRTHPRPAPPQAPLPASGDLADARRALRDAPGEVVVEVSQEQQIILDQSDPGWYWRYDRSPALRVARFFGRDGDLPLVLLFASLTKRDYWWFPLAHITTDHGLTEFLKRFFGSPEFTATLIKVEQAHGQI
ncbi:MAG TPA: hypothetical protein VFU60_16325 [Ktedonobacterales bacterium]|nr:hypothetical protein [Ktedonobacterales bacterium]